MRFPPSNSAPNRRPRRAPARARARSAPPSCSPGPGATPYTFSGPVYFTGPYNNAPFGLSIAVPAVAGPFNLGTVVTRATINVQQYTGRVVVTASLPRIVKGVPIRIRKIIVAVNKQGFLSNPDQLRPAVHGKLGHRVRPGQQRKLDGVGQVPVPGRQLRRPRVQAVVHGDELREGLESQRREPRNDAEDALGPVEHQVGARAAAQAARLAPDHASTKPAWRPTSKPTRTRVRPARSSAA